MRTFVIDGNKIVTQGCVMVDGALLRYDVEVQDEVSIAGNIYKGRVTNLNKEKSIGFIDIGLAKKGMINFKDVAGDVHLVAGQDVLVQVISDPYEEKGAKLTTELSFQGKYLVLFSGSSNVGISKKIDSAEKKKFLVDKVKAFIGDKAYIGAVIRTEAANASLDALADEFQSLMNQLTAALQYRVLGNAPRLIREQKGFLEQYNKLFNPEEDRWLTNDQLIYDYCVGLWGKKTVQYYAGHELFDYAGCKGEIDEIRGYKLPLPSGGELVVDYTEACVVIDVNSGKQRQKPVSADVLFDTNCEAMKKTRWLLEKADISGAIIVDLINMNSAQKKQQLLDRAKMIFSGSDCYVVGISALGFLEITRKRGAKPAYKIFEYQRPLDGSMYYEPNMLYYLTRFVNEVRRMSVHHSGKQFKFFATSAFIESLHAYGLVLSDGFFYENHEIEVELIEDDTLAHYYKITY